MRYSNLLINLIKKGYIFPLNVYINHIYGNNDDFVMHGTVLKVETQNNYLLFDNQGNLLGITYNLFMRIFYDYHQDDDFEYNLSKMESAKKT